MNPTYDISKSYDWNYDHGPVFSLKRPSLPPAKRKIKIFDFELNSPLGIPAGPLLNANWIQLYADLGWDIPVYKTVRSIARACHPNPNCAFVDSTKQLHAKDSGGKILTIEAPKIIADVSITNSFGMPSKDPKEWMPDIGKANKKLHPGQVMIVSIVGTPGVGKSLAADYAHTAKLAKEAGAQIIEANYSCPNVCSGEGSIYSDSELSKEISAAIRKEIGNTPFLIKMGTIGDPGKLESVIRNNVPFVDGIAGINTIAMKVYNPDGTQALPGEGRLTSGICGSIIRETAQEFTVTLAKIRKVNKYDFLICGVGGIMTPADIDARLAGGADIVMAATSAMWEPRLAGEWKKEDR